MCVVVCVDHLKRCKTSFVLLMVVFSWFSLLKEAGGSSTIASLLPTKTLAIGGDTRPDQSGVPANLQKWEEAQPKNLHAVYLSMLTCCTVVAIWYYFILFWTSLHQNLPLSKDVENLLRHEFHAGSTKFSWQFLRDCLMHVRCIPQQNSHCCF